MPQTAVQVYRAADGSVPLQEWLDELKKREPRAWKKCLERILRLARCGYEMGPPLAKLLRGGIYELRVRIGTVNYRILYFFHGPGAACLSHGFTKESEVPPAEIDLAIQRKKLVGRERTKYTATWGS